MNNQTALKPPLLVAAPGPNPEIGSEPGKAYHWAKALAEFYQIHYICHRPAAEHCRQSGLCEGWTFYPIDVPIRPAPGINFYRFYHQWCQRAIEKCLALIPEIKPVGLHHPALGSFRMLPSYFRLPIPYTLGPLGGGETAPFALLRGSSLPWREMGKELVRPLLNYGSLLNPHVRRVLRHARMVLATTPETERLLVWAGAAKTATVFPDVINLSGSPPDPMSGRRQQLAQLPREFRCIWLGRALWWKGGQTALRFIRLLKDNGINASLDIYSAGFALEDLKQKARNLQLNDSVRFNAMVSRDQLLQAHQRSHLFIFPSLHESGSSAIPEAYSTALPSMTLALGGTWFPTDPKAGLNEVPPDVQSWLAKGVEMVKRWTYDPQLWLNACQAALAKLPEFAPSALVERTRTHLVPHYNQENRP